MITVHEPAVAYTDLGLALLGGVFSWRLARRADRTAVASRGAVIMGGLASAALWGAVFHAFFPAKTATPAGRLMWIPVAFSIGVVAAALLHLGLRLLAPRLPPSVRRAIVAAYAIGYVFVVLADDSFTTIVVLYGPTLVLVLFASGREAIARRGRGWMLVATGVATSIVAAGLQQGRVALHPVHFDHNAVYHVVQGVALVLLYRGFVRARLPSPAAPGETDTSAELRSRGATLA